MTIHYAHVKSEAGPFIFIRLTNTIDQSKHDIRGWAQQLSAQYFSGLPVVVHNHDKDHKEILTTFPPDFQSYSVVANMAGAGVGLSTMQVSLAPTECK
jgi:hypothetical protein